MHETFNSMLPFFPVEMIQVVPLVLLPATTLVLPHLLQG